MSNYIVVYEVHRGQNPGGAEFWYAVKHKYLRPDWSGGYKVEESSIVHRTSFRNHLEADIRHDVEVYEKYGATVIVDGSVRT